MQTRPEFENAEVKDKLGAAVPTRRPYDSATAPGFMSVGDAAGHVNPTTGGGIAGAAYAGTYAGDAAVDALEQGDVSEDVLWSYNTRVMSHFGGRYAALDLYNIFTTAYDLDDLMALLASLPADKLSEQLYDGKAEIGLMLKLRTAVKSFGHWGTLYDFYRIKKLADRLTEHYEQYPDGPDEFVSWQDQRDEIMEDVYETTGAEPKY
jgi:flavin-dependent dehydrogenase